ncbi:peptide ABC transporter permease [Canibacter zhoujuaniae]|nr:peptide ABC transporter permease [Canibacter zhoujuaniae]
MSIFKFFFLRVFLRKPLLSLTVFLLLLAGNYIAFTTVRTIVSTIEGAQEASRLTSSEIVVSNLDPNSNLDFEKITETRLQEIYNFLSSKYEYGLFTDGYIVDLPNRYDVEIPAVYMNQTYSNLNGFAIASGEGITFESRVESSDLIPVLVGRGLTEDYPVGSTFTMVDPVLHMPKEYVVKGILAENTAHSNLYALDSKQYYNFSIVVPVTEDFIEKTDLAFKLNGLMDLVLINATAQEIKELQSYIKQIIAVDFNYFSEQQNIDFYNQYFKSSINFLAVVSVILLVAIILLSVWSSLISVRTMIREFTINLLVGLSYKKFRRIFFSYYAGLSLLALIVIFVLAAYSRQSFWIKKDAYFMTYGSFGGLIFMDWVGITAALIVDVLIAVVVSKIAVYRVKRIPITVGVLQ